MRKVVLCMSFAVGSLAPIRADLITFEELTQFTATGSTGSYYNGDSGIGSNTNGWTSGGVFFNNDFSTSFGGLWSGWSYSTVQDNATAGFGNQYASWPRGGSDGIGGVDAGGTYAVAFGFAPNVAYINLPTGVRLESVDIANTTYSALSMLNGDAFARQFGTPVGAPDFFRVTFTGYDGLHATGATIGSLTVDLADYTFSENLLDYVLGSWLQVDLSPIATASSVGVSFDSSDVGPFGINTPTYLALDNLSFSSVPEPGSLSLVGVAATIGILLRWRRSLYAT